MIPARLRIQIALVALLAMVKGTYAAPLRQLASVPLTPIPNLQYSNVTTMFGGNQTTVSPVNWGMGIFNLISIYPSAIGQIAYVILFAIPFMMMWIANANMTLPALVGMLFSLYVFLKIPADYAFFAVGAFAISMTALIYSLITRR